MQLLGEHAVRNDEGFTLIELSVVIVIIGLIVAGVVAGASLVEQSKIRSLTSDYQKYMAAVSAFRLQYNYLPGDLPNGSQYGFGGGDHGNGNRFLQDDASHAGWHSKNNAELTQFWIHLGQSGAKLLPNDFQGGTGATNAVSSLADLDELLPKDSFDGHWGVISNKPSNSGQGSAFVLGTTNVGASTNWAVRHYLTPRAAFSLDNKLDDGNPFTGNVLAKGGDGSSHCCLRPTTGPTYDQGGDVASCTSGAAASYDATANYSVSYDSNECRLNLTFPAM